MTHDDNVMVCCSTKKLEPFFLDIHEQYQYGITQLGLIKFNYLSEILNFKNLLRFWFPKIMLEKHNEKMDHEIKTIMLV
jgi:hypothetical protein